MRFLYITFLFLIAILCVQNTAQAEEGQRGWGFTSFKDIAYVEGSQSPSQHLDIYTPARKARQSALQPVLVYVHGGAWIIGDKSQTKRREIRNYTQNGILFVTLNYRLGEDGAYPKNIEDVQAAINWITNNISAYGGNPNAMVLVGHSAGAHLIAEAEIERLNEGGTPAFNTIIPVDTASFDLNQSTEAKLGHIVDNAKAKVFGQSVDILRAASPLFSLQTNKPYPNVHVFVTALRSDATAQSKLFTEALSQRGYNAKLNILPADTTHTDMNNLIFEKDSEIYTAIIEALRL